jgi:hypothetical protein
VEEANSLACGGVVGSVAEGRGSMRLKQVPRKYRPNDKRVVVSGLAVRQLSESEIIRLHWAVDRAMARIPVYVPVPLPC